jgi:glycosyl transferase, family 25
MTKIFVINLSSSKDRRESILHQFHGIGLRVILFTAINGREDNHPLFKNYNPVLRWKSRCKSLSRGQLGCFASHYLLWEKCVQLSEPIVVLEDDALLFKREFLSFYRSIPVLSAKYECIRLFDNRSKHHSAIPVEQMAGFGISKFTKGHMGTTGYFLTPPGAKKFLSHAQQWFLPVDIFMDRFWANRVECFGITPPCLTDDPGFPSTIKEINDEKSKRTLLMKFRREFFSLQEQVRKRLHNLKFRLSNL